MELIGCVQIEGAQPAPIPIKDPILVRLPQAALIGIFSGYHSELYYGDFEKPSPREMFRVEWGGTRGILRGWQSRAHNEVKHRIEALSGASFDSVAGISSPKLRNPRMPKPSISKVFLSDKKWSFEP